LGSRKLKANRQGILVHATEYSCALK
jgi:hypothetical protein